MNRDMQRDISYVRISITKFVLEFLGSLFRSRPTLPGVFLRFSYFGTTLHDRTAESAYVRTTFHDRTSFSST